MTQQHPITPPSDLVYEWAEDRELLRDPLPLPEYIATRAAHWAADQELEACCEWLVANRRIILEPALRAARRPKPPSLKEQARQALGRFSANAHTTADQMQADFDTIRRALEQLDD